jgi:hypothetical protein
MVTEASSGSGAATARLLEELEPRFTTGPPPTAANSAPCTGSPSSAAPAAPKTKPPTGSTKQPTPATPTHHHLKIGP